MSAHTGSAAGSRDQVVIVIAGVGYASRSFARHVLAETGMTPLRCLTAQRLLEARQMLETTDLTIEEIAPHCGLGTPANMRLHFARETGTTPTAYRNAFRGLPEAATGSLGLGQAGRVQTTMR